MKKTPKNPAQPMFRLMGAIYLCLVFLTDFISSLYLLLFVVAATLTMFLLFIFALPSMELRSILFATAMVAFVFSVGKTHWPLKLRFIVLRQSLQAAVEAAHSGRRVEDEAWYGLFRPKRIRLHGTGGNGAVSFDESFTAGAFSGVVYAPEEVPGVLNYDVTLSLAEHWYYVHGD